MSQKPTYNELEKPNAIEENEEIGPDHPMQEGKKVNKALLLLLTLCLGGIGVHQFYMKKIKRGIFHLVFCFTLVPNGMSLAELLVYLPTKTENLQQYFRDNKTPSRGKSFAGLMLYFFMILIAFISGAISGSPMGHRSKDQTAMVSGLNFYNLAMDNATKSELSVLSFSGENPPNGFHHDNNITIAGKLTVLKDTKNRKDWKIKSTMNFYHKNSRNIITIENNGHFRKKIGAKKPEIYDVENTIEYLITLLPAWVILFFILFFISASPIGSIPTLYFSLKYSILRKCL